MAGHRRLDEALAYLETLTANAVKNGTLRLPSTRRISQESGFSRRTIGKALAILAQKRGCVVVSKGGIFAGSSGPAPQTTHLMLSETPAAAPNWRRVSWAISERINAGAFPAGAPLPSCKELSSEYGISHSTLLKALGSLVADGRLHRHGKRYEPASAPRPCTASTLVFIGHGDSLPDMTEFTLRSAEYLRHLEKICIRHGLELVFISFRDAVQEGWSPAVRAIFSPGSPHPIVGVLVWILGLNAYDLNTLSINLSSFNKPVAIFDEGGHYPLPRDMATHPLFRIFATGYTPKCGLDMGTYLANRGHSSAAFFSTTADSPVYRSRAGGVQLRLQGASPDAQVHRVTLESDMSEEAFTELLKENPAYRNADRVINTQQPDPHERRQAMLTTQMVFMRFVKDAYAERIRSALALPGVTAWVAQNDMLAFVLLDMLKTERVNVPGKLSVVGFDDVPDAYGLGLTTYNFNVPAIVEAMMDHILGGAQSRSLKTTGIIEIPGYVVERRSSGAVKKR